MATRRIRQDLNRGFSEVLPSLTRRGSDEGKKSESGRHGHYNIIDRIRHDSATLDMMLRAKSQRISILIMTLLPMRVRK